MKDDGGTAFPRAYTEHYTKDGSLIHRSPGNPGMSLRQWYAGLAMQGYRAAGDRSAAREVC